MFQHIQVRPLHSTFGAEATNVDFTIPIPEEVHIEIRKAVHKYGVIVCRSTGLDDERHVAFAGTFGPLDSMKAAKSAGVKMRYDVDELTDQSNLDESDDIIEPTSLRGQFNKGNFLFHVDNSYNHQRASYSMLRAVEIPPIEAGGATEFADTRTAFDELPTDLKAELLSHDYETHHSIWHSRKLASPEFFAPVDPNKYPKARRKLIQLHEESGRLNLCLPSHCCGIEGLSEQEALERISNLHRHVTCTKYVLSVRWENEGDLIIWDNRAVMHRGTPMTGVHRRDMRRATILDTGANAFSLNAIDPAASWAATFDVARMYGALPEKR